MSFQWLSRQRHRLQDWQYRKRLAFEQLPSGRFTIRLARSVADYDGCFRLVQAAYVARGIADVAGDVVRITPQHLLPEAYVLLAEEGEQLVGTMTVTLDSPAELPLDNDYGSALATLRGQALRLCEVGSQAVVERCRGADVAALMCFAAFNIASQKLRADRIVIGVNPSAVYHLRAAFGFQPLGPARHHAQLVAPVVGLQCNLHTLYDFLEAGFPRLLRTGLSVAEHCFGAPLPCIDLPQGSHAELMRWKMPREVFQRLFGGNSDRLRLLEPRARRHLEQLRSPTTVGHYQCPEPTPPSD